MENQSSPQVCFFFFFMSCLCFTVHTTGLRILYINELKKICDKPIRRNERAVPSTWMPWSQYTLISPWTYAKLPLLFVRIVQWTQKLTRSTCFNYFMNRSFQGYCITVWDECIIIHSRVQCKLVFIERCYFSCIHLSMSDKILVFFAVFLQQPKRYVILEDVLQKCKKKKVVYISEHQPFGYPKWRRLQILMEEDFFK